MLHNILGFGGRMGRLEYFFACMALGFLVMLLVVALTLGFMPHIGHGDRGPPPPGLMIMLLGLVLPIYLWFALAFQAKRYRDMGWNPLYVIPGSIGGLSIIMLLSPFVPGLGLLGLLLNLLLSLCLWFWPSEPTGDGGWYNGSSYDGPADRRPEIDRAPAPTSRRPATVRTSAPAPVLSPAPSGFGRRGL
jgi:uncharacterized membrane protein YhaH (DUF805 family)